MGLVPSHAAHLSGVPLKKRDFTGTEMHFRNRMRVRNHFKFSSAHSIAAAVAAAMLLGLTCVTTLDVRRTRHAFTALCPSHVFSADYFDRDEGIALCPQTIRRESEWFGLSGPVLTLEDSSDLLAFDKAGNLVQISGYSSYFGNYSAPIVRDGNNLRYRIGDTEFQIRLDAQHRVVEKVVRCMANCAVGQLKAEGNGKLRDYKYPDGTAKLKATYEYFAHGLRIRHEQFDYRDGNAVKPGTVQRVIESTYRILTPTNLTLEETNRFGPPGSQVFRRKKEWRLSPEGHIITWHENRSPPGTGSDAVDWPLSIDSYGNWIKWGSWRKRRIEYD
ncbi:hypothetical protein Turpa_1010 [Turneriella parva DSM 21527]|uniref:Uncharacterized protein n=1 Tax=Turneriella parva (strain ATCC BAA-1111 / DSM 21527 / NCTC 11395 / H) TaxID=869212 RepID=I4B302_TURPD|nr:hypothetical protein Turpa_1010 [Turneriella parva DSM 21527]